mmetsp:Transcript_38279/g.62243  ORF Transcript_38279/g.62243 Transcript_38279/m.62243 type:complete len:81 (-) Transcript_38279:204-446(-)
MTVQVIGELLVYHEWIFSHSLSIRNNNPSYQIAVVGADLELQQLRYITMKINTILTTSSWFSTPKRQFCGRNNARSCGAE